LLKSLVGGREVVDSSTNKLIIINDYDSNMYDNDHLPTEKEKTTKTDTASTEHISQI
jgi:hypothetical protein